VVKLSIDQAWHRLPLETLFGPALMQASSYPQPQPQVWTAFFGAACSGIEAPERADPDFDAFEAINREVFEAFAVAGGVYDWV